LISIDIKLLPPLKPCYPCPGKKNAALCGKFGAAALCYTVLEGASNFPHLANSGHYIKNIIIGTLDMTAFYVYYPKSFIIPLISLR